MQRTLDGELCSFCCYGCCIAFQVKAGRKEEFEAAWLLIRLGVGGFLSMNVMLISLVIYAGAFDADAWLIPWIHLLLWIFATPALIILGEPYLRETLANARQGRLTSSALVVLGVGAAYAYSVFATIERSEQVYFDTATMVLMLFTVGSYIEAAGRARAARDLEPLLAAESECATVVEEGREVRRPVREIGAGMLVRVRPGERVPVDGVVVEGESHADEAVITGESRRIVKGVGSAMIAGSINLDGPLLIESSGAGTATRWATICRSVRDALSHRSPLQRVADQVVGISVPVVLVLGGAHGPLLGELASLRRGAAGRARGAGGRLPVRGRPRRSACNLARHRTLGALRLPRPRPRRARGPGAHAAHRLRQDRHADVGQGAPRRHRERGGGERRSACKGSRAGAPFRARAGARDRRRGRRAADRAGRRRATFAPCPAVAFAGASTASLWRPGTAPLMKRPGLAARADARRAGAGAGGDRPFGDLCRLGRPGSRRAVARRHAAFRGAFDDCGNCKPSGCM